jgi:hypothetical protein
MKYTKRHIKKHYKAKSKRHHKRHSIKHHKRHSIKHHKRHYNKKNIHPLSVSIFDNSQLETTNTKEIVTNKTQAGNIIPGLRNYLHKQ